MSDRDQRGHKIFNGLAHLIKGGIFFWYGLLTLGRWMGCFADIGWAWNVRPTAALVGRRKASMPSAEFVESSLYFFYGASNAFLEHLGHWGGVLAFGGGLVRPLFPTPDPP